MSLQLYVGIINCTFLQNVYLRAQQKVHYNKLLEQARDHEDNLEKSPKVAKESVEQTLTEKLELARRQKEDLSSTWSIFTCYSMYDGLAFGRI